MKNEDFNCPIPLNDADCVLMAHGGGGRMTHQLISNIFYPAFRNPLLEQDHDGCVFPVQEGRMACSTDSFVVDPIFFPGGDIGDPAVPVRFTSLPGSYSKRACRLPTCNASCSP